METIHPDAVPLIIANDKQVGWELLTPDFEFTAIVQIGFGLNPVESITSYIHWGDGLRPEVTVHDNWVEVKSWLDTLLQASRR